MKIKSNLDLLIEKLKAEVDHLKRSLDRCVEDHDFDGAKSFSTPLYNTKQQLYILQNLKDSNHAKKSRLKAHINRLEKSLSNEEEEFNHLGIRRSELLINTLKENTRNSINKLTNQLRALEQIGPEESIDDDNLLCILEDLKNDRISHISVEIIENKVLLDLLVEKDTAYLQLKAVNNTKIDDYLIPKYRSKLREIGYDPHSLKRLINDFKQLENTKFIVDLAIIYFEIFGRFGKNVKLIINS